jgi:hypothetical protein
MSGDLSTTGTERLLQSDSLAAPPGIDNYRKVPPIEEAYNRLRRWFVFFLWFILF